MNDFEELLRKATLKAEDTMISDFETNNAEHDFSPEFVAKMDALRSAQTTSAFTRVLKSAACFALVLLMGGTLYLGADTEAKGQFVGLLEIIESGSFIHHYLNDALSPQHEATVNVHALDDYREIHTMDECHALLSEASLQNTDDADPAYAVVHCISSAGTGWYIQTLLGQEICGQEINNCRHGAVGGTDIRYQYIYRYEGSCSLCEHKILCSETQWDNWQCRE